MDPYRKAAMSIIDPRAEAEAKIATERNEALCAQAKADAELKNAYATLLNQIARGVNIANSLAANDVEGPDSYRKRIEALTKLYNSIRFKH